MVSLESVAAIDTMQEYDRLHDQHLDAVAEFAAVRADTRNGMAEKLAGQQAAYEMAPFLLAMYGEYHSSQSRQMSDTEKQLTELERQFGMGNETQIFTTGKVPIDTVYGPGELYMTGNGFEQDIRSWKVRERPNCPSAIRYSICYADHLKDSFIGTVSVRAGLISGFARIRQGAIANVAVEDVVLELIKVQRDKRVDTAETLVDITGNVVIGNRVADWAINHAMVKYSYEVERLRAAQLRLFRHFTDGPAVSTP